MNSEATFNSREYAGEQDLPAMRDLLTAISDADGLDRPYSIEEIGRDIEGPNNDPRRDVRLWEDGQGGLAAIGWLWTPAPLDTTDGILYSFRPRPDMRGIGIESEIMDWAEARMRELGAERGLPARLFGSAPGTDSYGLSVLEAHGFTPERYFFRMACPLDQDFPEPEFPQEIKLDYSHGEQDLRRWVDAYNQSFIDHWNHHPLSYEDAIHHTQNDPHYVPELDLLAITEDRTVVAFAFCEIDWPDNRRTGRKDGWIHLLGTRRGYRKMGLGRAVLLAGLRALKEHGADTAKLGVDADSPTGALGLYESAGFRVINKNIVHSKEL